MKRTSIGLVFIAVGVIWALQNYGIIDWHWHFDWGKILVPAIMVIIGLKMFFGRTNHNHGE